MQVITLNARIQFVQFFTHTCTYRRTSLSTYKMEHSRLYTCADNDAPPTGIYMYVCRCLMDVNIYENVRTCLHFQAGVCTQIYKQVNAQQAYPKLRVYVCIHTSKNVFFCTHSCTSL